MPTASAGVAFHPATPDRWADIERLFGPRGACAGCWCMWPRMRGAEFARGKGAPHQRALRKLVTSGAEPGILAYVAGDPAGWCALAPREHYPRITHSRLFGGEEVPPGTWSVVCFFVARPFRGRGLSVRLLKEAARFATTRGARVLEGYPSDPKATRG